MAKHLTEKEKHRIYKIEADRGDWEKAWQVVTGRDKKTIRKPFNVIKLLSDAKREMQAVPSVEVIVESARYGITETYASNLRNLWIHWSELDGTLTSPSSTASMDDDWYTWRRSHLAEVSHAIEGHKEHLRSRALIVDGGGYMIPKHRMEPIHEQIIAECLKRDPALAKLQLQFDKTFGVGKQQEALEILARMNPLWDRFKDF